jgi:lysine-specific demethylase 8
MTQIQRIEKPTRAEFTANFLNKNTPVIITGVCSEWGAVTKWTPEYLRQVAGNAPITVHYHKDRNFHSWYLKPWEREDRKVTMDEWLKILLEGDDYKSFYMTEHLLRDISPELVKDTDLSGYVDKPDPLLFMGRDTNMPLHYHGTTEAFLCQLIGTKTVSLFPPSQFPLIYYRPWYSYSWLFSQVDTRNPDLQKFPKFARAKPWTFTLYPGEILFIPVHWGHVTSVPDYQVSTTFFWNAELRNYHFPFPGIHVLLRRAQHALKTGRKPKME